MLCVTAVFIRVRLAAFLMQAMPMLVAHCVWVIRISDVQCVAVEELLLFADICWVVCLHQVSHTLTESCPVGTAAATACFPTLAQPLLLLQQL
jgi:hypothetical protein